MFQENKFTLFYTLTLQSLYITLSIIPTKIVALPKGSLVLQWFQDEDGGRIA